MLALVNCIRFIEKNPGSLVSVVVALFFAQHRSATNSPITISSTLLSLNSLTLDYIGLLVSFSVSLIDITWMLENALFISQFCSSSSSSSSRAVITINLSIRLLHHQCSYLLPFAFVLMQYFHTLYSPASPCKHLFEPEQNVLVNINHSSCTCNGNHVGLLMMTGNIQKEKTMTQTTIRNF